MTTLPPVSSPVRDDLVSGGGVGVAGVLLRDPVVALLLQTVQLSGELSLGKGKWGTSGETTQESRTCTLLAETREALTQ